MTLEQLVQQWRDEASKLRAEAVGFDVDTRTELELDADIHEEHASQLEAWLRDPAAQPSEPELRDRVAGWLWRFDKVVDASSFGGETAEVQDFYRANADELLALLSTRQHKTRGASGRNCSG